MEALQRLHNRGSISTGYDIDNSLKFEADNTEYMKFTSSQSGSDLKRMAFNIWLKRTELGRTQTFMLLGNGGSNSTRLDLGFDSSDRLQIRNVNSNWRLTTQVFRDTSAWYHLFFQFNTLDTTADDRIKVWVNGNLIAIGDYTTVNDPGYDATLGFNRNYANILGGREIEGSNSQMFSGYIAQVYGSGGTPPSVTDFGEFDEDTGIWKPKDISGISPPEPINGFFLDFTDASDLGNDASGNNNNWTLNNITSADQATDTPTNNFCTFNPLMYQNNKPTISEGAMKSTGGGGTWNQTWGTIGVKNGKWYYEMKVTNTSSTGYIGASTTPAEGSNTSGSSLMYDTSFMMGTASGIDYYYWQNGSQTSNEATGWGNLVNNDVLGLALDLDASTKKFYLYKNGSLLNSGGTNLPTNMQDEFIFPLYVQYENRQDEINFGGYTISSISTPASDANGYGTFEYSPPSGYYALCTKNLEEFG